MRGMLETPVPRESEIEGQGTGGATDTPVGAQMHQPPRLTNDE